MRYKNLEDFHKTVQEAFVALEVALRGDLPDPDTEEGHFEIASLRGVLDKLDLALFRGLNKTLSSQKRVTTTLELTLEDLGI